MGRGDGKDGAGERRGAAPPARSSSPRACCGTGGANQPTPTSFASPRRDFHCFASLSSLECSSSAGRRRRPRCTARRTRRSSAGRCSRRRGRMRSPARRRCSRSSRCCRSACPAAPAGTRPACTWTLAPRSGWTACSSGTASRVPRASRRRRAAPTSRAEGTPPPCSPWSESAAAPCSRRTSTARAEPLVEGGLVVDTHLPTGGDEEVTMRGSTDRGSYGGRAGGWGAAVGAATGWWRDCAAA